MLHGEVKWNGRLWEARAYENDELFFVELYEDRGIAQIALEIELEKRERPNEH